MKYLLSLACMCMFMFMGSILPTQSQSTSDYNRVMVCNNGDCVTWVGETDSGWDMRIWCDSGHYEYSGSGSYGGSVCGMTME